MTTFVFLDTNIFLHFPQMEDIPWTALVGKDHVTLVVTSVIIRELNRHKDSPDSPKLRDRAALALKKLHDYSEKSDPITVRDAVTLAFHMQEPLLNFASAGLSRELPDDCLVATILEFKRHSAQRDVVLMTDDLGLKLKARAFEIQTLRPPQDLRLPDEVDPSQKRIRELEERVRQLQLSVPELKLVFRSKEDRIQFVLKPEVPLSPSVLAWHRKRLRLKFPEMSKPNYFAGAQLAAGTILSPAAYDDYNGRLNRFYSEYDEHWQQLQDFLNNKRRIVKLDVWAWNTGTCPAKDTDVFVNVPDDVNVVLESGLPKRPSPPEPPDTPKTRAEANSTALYRTNLAASGIALNSFQGQYQPLGGDYGFVSSHRRDITRAQRSGQEALMHIVEAKHNLMTSVDTIYVVFDAHEKAHSFSIDYTIFCANIPEKRSGQLHVVVGAST
jgi:rRNA-processing protein FCF1